MMELTRRDFLKVGSVTAAGAVAFTGCAPAARESIIQSPLLMPEDTLNSFENWYGSVCKQCGAGCGIVVRVIEGRAKKIEGNPDHPLNAGKICARGVSGVQALYHPDRLRSPLRRSGPRGSGRYTSVSWEEALGEVAARLDALKKENQAQSVVMAVAPLRGVAATITKRFMTNYGGTVYSFETLDNTVVRRSAEAAFGDPLLPKFDLENATYVLSFGANFLEPWLSQVSYNRAYGEFRQGGAERGTLIQFEQRMSTTGASADEWVHLPNPGTDGVLALSIAYVIVSKNLTSAANIRNATGGAGAAALRGFEPAEAEKKTGVPAARIEALAEAFAKAKAPLAIGGMGAAGHTNGLFNLSAIFTLNHLVGNVGRRGGVLLNPSGPTREFGDQIAADPVRAWRALTDRMQNKQINILMLHDANPLYGLPPTVKFGPALKNVPMIISFSSFMDETTAMADLILPDSSYLESWGDYVPDPGVAYETLGLQQPVVNPLYSTRTFSDALLTLAKTAPMAEDMKSGLAWETTRDALKALTTPLYEANRGSIRKTEGGKTISQELWWNKVLAAGGWWDERGVKATPIAPKAFAPRDAADPKFSGDEKQYMFHLNIFPSAGVGDGSMAHLPWTQFTPDPMTTIAWQTWIEVNPKDAEKMGLRTNDIVRVDSPVGSLETTVYVYPGIAPGTVAIPAGQGHTHMGRYAEKRGANPLTLVDPEMIDASTGALAFNATRVRLTKTGKRYSLPRIEGGAVEAREPFDYTVIQVTDGKGGGATGGH